MFYFTFFAVFNNIFLSFGAVVVVAFALIKTLDTLTIIKKLIISSILYY